jgi:chorismate mutase
MWVEFSCRVFQPSALAAVLLLGACASSPPPARPAENSKARPSPVVSATVPASIEEADIAKINTVLSLTRELLLLAPDVARVNWNNKVSPENKTQEAQQLKSLEQAAVRYQTDVELVRAYFQALIEADRFVQTELHKQWRSQGVPPIMTLTRTPAQLQAAATEIRPKLLAALSQMPDVLKKKGAAAQIQARALEILPNRSALSEPTRNIAIAPLLSRALN